MRLPAVAGAPYAAPAKIAVFLVELAPGTQKKREKRGFSVSARKSRAFRGKNMRADALGRRRTETQREKGKKSHKKVHAMVKSRARWQNQPDLVAFKRLIECARRHWRNMTAAPCRASQDSRVLLKNALKNPRIGRKVSFFATRDAAGRLKGTLIHRGVAQARKCGHAAWFVVELPWGDRVATPYVFRP
jgi:hypothetical protein